MGKLMRATYFIIPAIFLFANAIADTEPNNTWENATALVKDATTSGAQSDADWYVINVTGSQRLLIDLTFTHADGNMQLGFYEDGFAPGSFVPGVLKANSEGNFTDNEFLDTPVSTSGIYYLWVYAGGATPGGNKGNSYTLTWTELTTADDGNEPNNMNNEAVSINENAVVLGVQSDEDWYSINVTQGNERVLASLRFHNLGIPGDAIDLDLELRDSGGTVLASSLNGVGINESINYVVPAPGIYHLRVFGDDNADGYALSWDGVVPSSTSTTPAPASSSSGSLAPVLVFALLLTGVLRRKPG